MFTANRVILNKALREHIGGRWAISLLAFVINAPINLLSIFTNASASEGQESSARWWIVAVLGYLAFGAVLWLASSTLFRNRRISPVPIWWVVVLGVVAGATRGIVVGVVAEQMDLAVPDPTVVLTRVMTGAFMGAVLLPIAALVLSVVFTYRHERARLIEEQVESERALLQSTGTSEILRSALLESVQSDLDMIRTSTQARELSHRIWENESDHKPPEVSFWRILRTSVTKNPYPSVTVISFWSISAFGSLAVVIGPVRALLQILFSAVAIAGTFWVGRRLNESRRIPGPVSFLFTMAVTVLITSGLASWIFDPRPWPAGAGLVLINAIWLPTLTILFGIAVTAVRSSESVIEELKEELSQTELVQVAMERETEELRRELAGQLHGSVQSRLLITAALLESPEMAKVTQLSESSHSMEALQIFELVNDPGVDVQTQVSSLVKAWSSLMAVEVTTVSLNVSQQLGNSIARVVEEGMANAYRHGKASQVHITIQRTDSSIVVRVEDNGKGLNPDEDIAYGLGMNMITTLKPSVWGLSNTQRLGPTGCELRVEFDE